MPISNTNVSMNSIAREKFPSALPPAMQNVSLHGLSVDGVNDFQYVGGAYTDLTGSPNQVAPYMMSEFRGWSATSDTTYNNTLSEQEYSVDSNIIARPQLRVMYLSGNIDVNWYGWSENPSPANGLVYRITNPASGYTVRETHTETGDGPNYWTYSNIQPNGSAVSVPTSTFYADWQPSFESGGGYDDPGYNNSTLTVSLIFEKSGETTFTYNFTLDVELETAGEGGL